MESEKVFGLYLPRSSVNITVQTGVDTTLPLPLSIHAGVITVYDQRQTFGWDCSWNLVVDLPILSLCASSLITTTNHYPQYWQTLLSWSVQTYGCRNWHKFLQYRDRMTLLIIFGLITPHKLPELWFRWLDLGILKFFIQKVTWDSLLHELASLVRKTQIYAAKCVWNKVRILYCTIHVRLDKTSRGCWSWDHTIRVVCFIKS